MISSQHERLDVAAAEHEADLASDVGRLVLDERGQADRASAFDHRLLDLEQHQDGLLDVVLGDEDHVVDEIADHRQRQRAGMLDADAVGDGGLAALAVLSVLGIPRRRETFGLHTDDADVGFDGARRRGDPGDQAAAADGDDEGVDLRLLRQHLEADRALAGDDRRVVEGMHQRVAALGDELHAGDAGVFESVALEHDLGAEAARVLHLYRRGEARHDDGRGDAHAFSVIGDGLRMVAGRDREDALGSLLERELRHLVERAAFLERGGELQVLDLEIDLAAADRRERARVKARRVGDLAANALLGGADVGDRHRGSVHPTRTTFSMFVPPG